MIVLLLRLYWEFLLIGMFSMGGGMEGPHPSRRPAGCGKRLATVHGG